MRAHPAASSPRLDRCATSALLLVLVSGLVHLPFPFHGDQAIFTLATERMARGGALYLDFWDLKQPGIHGFYLLAGTLFGFSEVGIHLLELLWMMALALLVSCVAATRVGRPFAAAAMLLTVGQYYAIADDWTLTQVEGLVGLPLLASLWLIHASLPAGRPIRAWPLFLAGVMGGAVAAFKLLYAPLVAGFWCLGALYALRVERRALLAIALRMVVPFVAGVAVVLLTVVLHFGAQGTLDRLLWTTFVYPRLALAAHDAYLPRLVDATTWFVSRSAPLLALGLLGAWHHLSRRRTGAASRRRPPRQWDLVTAMLCLWVAGAGLAILVQQISWWRYHFVLLVVPVGLLAAMGLEVVSAWWERVRPVGRHLDRPWLVAAGVAFFAASILPLGTKLAFFVRDGLAIHPESRARYQERWSESYRPLRREVAFLLQDEALQGPIFAFGNPLVIYLSGRRQALAMNGWSSDVIVASQWGDLARELEERQPPYVFVDARSDEEIAARPEASAVLEARYAVLRTSPRGTWLVREGPVPGRSLAAFADVTGHAELGVAPP